MLFNFTNVSITTSASRSNVSKFRLSSLPLGVTLTASFPFSVPSSSYIYFGFCFLTVQRMITASALQIEEHYKEIFFPLPVKRNAQVYRKIGLVDWCKISRNW